MAPPHRAANRQVNSLEGPVSVQAKPLSTAGQMQSWYAKFYINLDQKRKACVGVKLCLFLAGRKYTKRFILDFDFSLVKWYARGKL